ncbi:MAG: ribbon-helix-helix domain-containing protein [Candidatus Diapherotrites archaeon]
MGETLVRFEGAQELIMDKLVEAGVYKTRSEAIRAGIIELGKEYEVFKSIQDLEDELAVRKMQKISEEIKQGKRRVFTKKEVMKKYGFK